MKTEINTETAETVQTGGDQEVAQEQLVRPGERLLIAITFPEELEESESCHPDIILEDFLASRNDGSWQVEVHSILPNRRGEARREGR